MLASPCPLFLKVGLGAFLFGSFRYFGFVLVSVYEAVRLFLCKLKFEKSQECTQSLTQSFASSTWNKVKGKRADQISSKFCF